MVQNEKWEVWDKKALNFFFGFLYCLIFSNTTCIGPAPNVETILLWKTCVYACSFCWPWRMHVQWICGCISWKHIHNFFLMDKACALNIFDLIIKPFQSCATPATNEMKRPLFLDMTKQNSNKVWWIIFEVHIIDVN